MSKIYSIYRITNTVNSKIYIGYTSNVSKRFKEYRYNGSREQHPIHRAIRKYGIESFIFEVIYQSYDKVHTHDVMEPYFISEYRSRDGAIGYNVASGGKVPTRNPLSEEQRLRISLATRGKKKSLLSIQRQLETKRKNNTLAQTPEVRARAAATLRNRNLKQDDGWKQRRVDATKATRASWTQAQMDEWKKNCSEAAKKREAAKRQARLSSSARK